MSARLIRWLAVTVWLAVIFWFSDQTSLPGLGAGGSLIDVLFKKSGHVVVYGILGVLLYTAVLDGRRSAGSRTLLWAITLAAAYALSDELHQTFVPGRRARLEDFTIDVMAAALGAWVAARAYQPSPLRRVRDRWRRHGAASSESWLGH